MLVLKRFEVIAMNLINRLPLTRIKLLFARILYRIVHLVYPEDRRIIVRGGIKYEIDLSEGIDLSIFLFGNFQKHVSKIEYLSIPPDAVIFDVGANCGAMSLQYAQSFPSGRIYAFEPTHYAYSKLLKNLELNPELAEHITAVQSFISSQTSQQPDIKAYSSWKVGGDTKGNRHRIHGGTTESAEGVPSVSLDDFCAQNGIEKLYFIKIDTDGHELEVLKGAQQVIRRFRPFIIFEVGLYIMEEVAISFDDYLSFFNRMDYSLVDSGSRREINADNYLRHIPSKGTIDILAKPAANGKGA
jgi:FkbM family methyltransferase